jgi:hypothetical protein
MVRPAIEKLLALLAICALGLGLAACGGSDGGNPSDAAHTTATSPAPNFSTHHNDRDNDGDHNNDDEKVLDFGQPADANDRQALVALVTRYFAIAAAENGASGCRMLVSFIADGLGEGQPRQAQGSSCVAVLTQIFKQHHPLLVEKQATLRIIRVGVLGNRTLVVLDFPTIPEVRQISARRTDHGWKLLEPLDGILE